MVEQKKRPQNNPEGFVPSRAVPEMTGTLSNLPQSSPSGNNRKNILDETYIRTLSTSLSVYPPSVLGEFFAKLIEATGLKQWDNGQIYKSMMRHAQNEIDAYEISDIIGEIKRTIFLGTYVNNLIDGGLRPSARRFQVGRCPFCKKKDKFWVSPNGYCNCHYCNFPKSMDLINFYCRFYEVEIDEAIHKLAQEAGLDR